MTETKSYASYMRSPHKSIKHSTYFHAYDDLLAKYRGKKITFVEIGILGGGSLFMWRDFFGPEARIIGIDINPEAKKWEEHGFEIFVGSQSDEAFWKGFIEQVGEVDVLLDDGGHTYDQQIITFEMMISQIRDGGLLIVEDTHTSYQDGFGPRKFSFLEYTKKLIDDINARFRTLDPENAEKRIWSVKIYESIVAFYIDRTASHLNSASTVNDGADDQAKYYRYEDNEKIEKLRNVSQRFTLLRRLLAGTRLSIALRNLMAAREFKSKRYFD